MKRKGFTLIELLGVIIILGILSMITFPIILNQIKNAKQGIKDSTKALIIDAAKDYYEDNINNYDMVEGMTYCIDINTLTDNNYLNKKIKDEKLNDIDTTQKVKMTYHNDKFNYEVVDSCTKYTVTFDPNGGSVDTTSKEVIQNSAYGTLPTPTRAGYTFMGWNGKNLLNIIDTPSITKYGITGYSSNETFYISGTNTSASNYGIISIYENQPKLEIGKTYTLSTTKELNNLYVQINYTNTSNAEQFLVRTYKQTSVTIPSSYSSSRYTFIGVVGNSQTIDETFKVQLEEGTEATPYEPYYITPETKVVQEQNHTLKAIWKAN